MSESNFVDNESEWPEPGSNSENSAERPGDQLKYPSCMPGVVVYTTGHTARTSKQKEGQKDEQTQLSAALDLALNAVRNATGKSIEERNRHLAGDPSRTSNVIPLGEMPLVVGEMHPAGEMHPEELSNGPAPVGPFAPAEDFLDRKSNGQSATDHRSDGYQDDGYEDDAHFDESEAIRSALRGTPKIPQSFHAQAVGVQGSNAHAPYAYDGYDPQKVGRRFGGTALATGFTSVIVLGFLGLYFYNSPSAITTNLNFPKIFEAATGIGQDESLPVVSPAQENNPQNGASQASASQASASQAGNNASGSSQGLIAPVPVTSVAVRANPHLSVAAAQGESGTDIPLTVKIDPVPGGNTAVVINGLPEGASLTAGAESTKGVWIVKPGDLETLALRTPLGLSGQYDLDIELVAANGNTMDRKSFRVVLSSEAPSTVAVNGASAPESGQQAAAQSETQTASAAMPSANAYISERAYNEALAASGLSLFDFQERAKVNGLMIARGDSFMANGDISSARLLFERAGKDGSAVGATLAAMTYDPIFLKENGNHSMRPDAGKAQVWYAKAIALGSDEAKTRRAALDTFLASN